MARSAGVVTRAAVALGLGLALLPLGILVADVGVRALAGDLALPPPSARALGLIGNSLLLALAVSALATLLGGTLALWLHVSRSLLARLVGRIYLLPFLLPSYVLALAWLSVAGRRQLFDLLLAWFVGPDRVIVAAYGFGPTAFVLALALAPVVTLIVDAGLRAIDADLVEEALVFEPPWQVVRRVLVPLALPSVAAAAAIVFALGLVEYGVPAALQQNVYAMEIYAQFAQDADPTHAALLALPVFVPALTALIAARSSLSAAPLRGRTRAVARLTAEGWPVWAVALTRLAVVASLASTLGPLLILALRVGSPETLLGAALAAAPETGLSLGVALVVALVAGFLAVPAARLASAGRNGDFALWALPLVLPAPLVGVALASAGASPVFDLARGIPLVLILAHLARFLPFAVLAAAAPVRRIDGALLDAAALPDVGRWRRLRDVELPLHLPAASAAALVAFVLSLGEIGATLLVVPPGQATLPLRVFNLMHYGATDAVAALALVVTATAGGAALLAYGARKAAWPWAT